MSAIEKRQTRPADAKRFRARWADAVRHDPDVRGSTLEVALCLVFDFANHETLACFPYLDTVAARVGTTARTVQRATKRLSELGYLETRIRGRGRSRAYFFRLPEVASHPERGDNVVALSGLAEVGKGDTRGTLSGDRATNLPRKGDENVASHKEPESRNPTIAAEAAHMERFSGSDGAPEAQSRAAAIEHSRFADTLERFLAVYPRRGSRDGVEGALTEALAEGADPARILAAARTYASEQMGNPARFIAYPENWLAKKRWEQHEALAAPASEAQILENLASIVIDGKSYAASAVSTGRARQLLEAGMVTKDQLRAVGVGTLEFPRFDGHFSDEEGECFPCRERGTRTLRNSGSRWLRWREPGAVLKAWRGSMSPARRRSMTGSGRLGLTMGTAATV